MCVCRVLAVEVVVLVCDLRGEFGEVSISKHWVLLLVSSKPHLHIYHVLSSTSAFKRIGPF